MHGAMGKKMHFLAVRELLTLKELLCIKMATVQVQSEVKVWGQGRVIKSVVAAVSESFNT